MASTTTTATTPMHLDPSTGWTCVACKLVFSSGQLQREHYRSDWHLYNMKRQIASLPPVPERDFQEKLLQHLSHHQQPTADAAHSPSFFPTVAPSSLPPPRSATALSSSSSSLVCTVCRNKKFRSRNAFDNHLQSRRHKEAEESALPVGAVAAAANAAALGNDEEGKLSPTMETVDHDDGGDEQHKDVPTAECGQVKEEGKGREDGIPPNECLFCEHKANSEETNLEHMSMQHGFLIPDLPFCADVSGLITYLGFKIGVGLTCIRCQCARFRSLDALRKHMRDSNHCNFRIDSQQEAGDVLLEFMDFYDYSSVQQYADDDDEVEEEEEEDDDAVTVEGQQQPQNVAAVLYDEGAFLVLPSGARIGHRSLVRYFRQRLGYGLGGAGDWHHHSHQGQLLAANAKKSSALLKQLGGQTTTAANNRACPVAILEASVKARARDVSFMKRTLARYRLRRELASNKLIHSRGRDDQQ